MILLIYYFQYPRILTLLRNFIQLKRLDDTHVSLLWHIQDKLLAFFAVTICLKVAAYLMLPLLRRLEDNLTVDDSVRIGPRHILLLGISLGVVDDLSHAEIYLLLLRATDFRDTLLSLFFDDDVRCVIRRLL